MELKPYYHDSAVTIYHGDSRNIVPQLGRFDLLLTDPPYGIGFAAQPTKWQRRAGEKPIGWDDGPVDLEFLHYLLTITRNQIVWGGNYYALPPSRGWLVWQKPDAPPSMGNAEMAWTSFDKNTRLISHSISATNAERVGHPTQKPIAVINWSLAYAGECRTVLDPFAGSGTTGRVCKDAGLHCVLVEREERYCEIAAKRMGQEVLALTD
jgi:site-specific DNA-methyltransferase (adenine-specific)